MGQALRSRLGLAMGDELAISALGSDLKARAPVDGFLDEPLGTYVYGSLPTIRAAAGAHARPNSVLVRYDSGADREIMRRRLSALPGVTAFEDTSALHDAVNSYLGLFYAFVGVTLVLGGAMAFALMFSAISASISERRTEVATLRAAGASFGTISHLITAENVLVTVAAIPLGLLVGYVTAGLFMDSFSSDQFSFALEVRASTFGLSAVAILLVLALGADLAEDPLQAGLRGAVDVRHRARRPPGGSRRSARASPGRRRGRSGGPRARSAARSGASPRGR